MEQLYSYDLWLMKNVVHVILILTSINIIFSKKKKTSINISKSNTTIIYFLKTIECDQKLYFGHIT